MSFIRELDPNVDLEDLLSESIDLFVAKVDRLDLHEARMLRMDPGVIAKIEEKLAAKTKDYSLTELFVALAGDDSWNPGDIKHLLKYSEDDLVKWTTTEESVDAVDLLAEFLRRFGSRNEDERSVVEKISRALNRVKERSPIDRCRVEYLIEDKKQK